MAMSEHEFDGIADRTLNDMVEALADTESEAFEVDLESGVLTIRFDDGARYVINSHRAARQIWMAAEASAWHFDWSGKDWRSTKSGEELWGLVREKVSKKLGKPLEIHPSSR